MRGRLIWFAAGTGAGIYTTWRAKRIAYRLTPAGLADQFAALNRGWTAFSDEVRDGMDAREDQIATELGFTPQARLNPAHDDEKGS